MATENLTQEELNKLAKDVLVDGVVDFDETTRLLGFMTPSVAQQEKFAEFRRLLERVRADGVITPEESAEVAAALRGLTARKHVPFSVTLRLVLMMFLQMMTFPVWFNTVVPYIRTLPGGERWVPFCGILMGIGVFASPVVCMLADRFLDSGKVLALCNLGAALALGGAYLTTNSSIVFCCLLGVTCMLMPTWSLVSAIAMNHASPASFPYIRVFGTLGWAAAAVFSVVAIGCFGISDFEKSPYIFSCGAADAISTKSSAPGTTPSAQFAGSPNAPPLPCGNYRRVKSSCRKCSARKGARNEQAEANADTHHHHHRQPRASPAGLLAVRRVWHSQRDREAPAGRLLREGI